VAALHRSGVQAARGEWTATSPLPGGDITDWLGASAGPAREVVANFERFVGAPEARHPANPPQLLRRLARAYGTRAVPLLERGLGNEVVPGLPEAELRYLVEREWARTADDVLWRRSKLGLHLDAEARAGVSAWLQGAFASA